MCLFYSSCILTKKGAKKVYRKSESVGPFDAAIVPGVPFKNGQWDSVMKGRVIWSCHLYHTGLVKNLIFSGAAVYSPYKEARIMGLYAQELGVPPENIFYDTLAEHSTENVYHSYLLAKSAGFKTIALATDPFQILMLTGFLIRRFKTPIYKLPIVYDSLPHMNNVNPTIVYKPLKEQNWKSIYERQNFWKRCAGTLGWHIDWSPYKNGRIDPL